MGSDLSFVRYFRCELAQRVIRIVLPIHSITVFV
jgi:hypothetical protein